jgi:geranylgeranyl pyrophosphate synthase
MIAQVTVKAFCMTGEGMKSYEDLPQQIKQFISLHLDEAFQKLSLQNLVEAKDYSLLLAYSVEWDQQFANLGRIAAGITDLEDTTPGQPKINLIDNLSSLVVYSCGACCSTPEIALPAAAAMDIIFMSAGLFDDIQDQDKVNSLVAKVGPGETLNIALTLLLLGQKLLTNTIKARLVDDEAFLLINRLNDCLLVGIKGQFLDLQEDQVPLRDRLENPDYYLTKNGLKAATLFSYLTELGATLGYRNSNHEFVSSYRKFGFALGMVVQLLADLGDFLVSGKPAEKSRDLSQHLPTLPTVYAYQALESEAKKRLFIEFWQMIPMPFEDIVSLLNSTPTVSQTIGLITQYAIEAENCLRTIDPTLDKLEHRSMLRLLQSFVESLRGHFLQAAINL